ncbi:MAG: hypothetical protein ACRD2P_07740 [Terriglobia bacterium]
MFRVNVDSLQAYLDFDPRRKVHLVKLDELIKRSAPCLKRYFHKGTPAGEPGMRFKMIGYGKFYYFALPGKAVEWPVVGVALQRNYISVYLSVAKNDLPLVQQYAGKLGELRIGRNNFSFEEYEDLKLLAVSSLFAEADRIFNADPSHSTQVQRARTIRGFAPAQKARK